MNAKPKVAFYWCASCGGCEEAIVDLAEDILMVAGAIDIVMWPVAMDFKRSDLEAMADGSIVAALVNGAIRTSEQAEMIRLMRRKCQVLVAFGACACQGGIPALANEFSRRQILDFSYGGAPSVVNAEQTQPQPNCTDAGHDLHLPVLHETVRTIDQVVDVDYYLPGCPPTPKLIKEAVLALLSGKLPPKGTTLAPDTALCEQCPHKDSKPTDLAITEFKRPHTSKVDPTRCLLAQGFLCMGPATRGGCEALCVRGNMPCSGCFGPTSRVRDQGAKYLSSIASSIAAKDEAGIDKTLDTIADPVGTFYRYGMSKYTLRRRLS